MITSVFLLLVLFSCCGHRDLHVLTSSFPTLLSSDLKCLALSTMEALIAAGPVVRRVRSPPGAGQLLPVDSEHCGVHQCLRAQHHDAHAGPEVARIVLTASGGPFRGRTRAELADVTVAQALAPPTWSMGPKITVDQSPPMNQGPR